jgi:DNA invertase Pin-like site-specific DNA recombinase
LYLDQQSIGTTTPAGRLMFQITGAFAEFERSMSEPSLRGPTWQAQKIGHALEKRIQSHLRGGKGMLAVARECGVGTGTVRVSRAFDGVDVAA